MDFEEISKKVKRPDLDQWAWSIGSCNIRISRTFDVRVETRNEKIEVKLSSRPDRLLLDTSLDHMTTARLQKADNFVASGGQCGGAGDLSVQAGTKLDLDLLVAAFHAHIEVP